MLLNISKKTKIVCTIGPASQTKEKMLALYKAGMSVMRVNFSHGDYEEQGNKILIRNELESEGIYIPWALDTKGPEIRCGNMENDKIVVKAGQNIRISMDDKVVGTPDRISVTYSGLYDDVNPGDRILIDDGNLELEIIGKDEEKRELEDSLNRW